MKIFDPRRHLPPGWDWERLRTNLCWGHFFSSLTMLNFLQQYFYYRDWCYLHIQQPDGTVLVEINPNWTMVPFHSLLQGWPLTGMWLFCIGMGFQVWRYYGSFTKDSMSIYTMRRLPDKWELHRRCWTQPLLSALTEVLIFAALAGLCWLLWWFATPAPCRPTWPPL